MERDLEADSAARPQSTVDDYLQSLFLHLRMHLLVAHGIRYWLDRVQVLSRRLSLQCRWPWFCRELFDCRERYHSDCCWLNAVRVDYCQQPEEFR